MKKWIVLITICIGMCSCLSHKKMLEENAHDITRFSKEKLNGTYKNEKNLWFNLEHAYRLNRNEKNIVPDSTYVTLKLLSNTQLQVSLKTQKDSIDSFVLKGQMRGSFFSPRNKFSLFPLFPLLYSREQYKILLGNDEDGHLILIKGSLEEGYAIVIGNGRKTYRSIKYTKL